MEPFDRLIHEWLENLGWTGEAAVRLCLAAVLGSLIGLEREARGREAGFRTNLLVCAGSALVMLISMRLAALPWPHAEGYNVSIDPGRIAYGVMTGIGFLGAGAIIKQEQTIRGLTTAAGLWCVAAIGLTVGMGMYGLALLAAALVLAALWLLHHLEALVPRKRARRLTVRCQWSAQAVDELIGAVRSAGGSVVEHGFRRREELEQADIELVVACGAAATLRAVEEAIARDLRYELISSQPA